jgi:hypothetical protein
MAQAHRRVAVAGVWDNPRMSKTLPADVTVPVT